MTRTKFGYTISFSGPFINVVLSATAETTLGEIMNGPGSARPLANFDLLRIHCPYFCSRTMVQSHRILASNKNTHEE